MLIERIYCVNHLLGDAALAEAETDKGVTQIEILLVLSSEELDIAQMYVMVTRFTEIVQGQGGENKTKCTNVWRSSHCGVDVCMKKCPEWGLQISKEREVEAAERQ